MRDQARMYTFESKPKLGRRFAAAIETDLHRRQGLTLKRQSLVESQQALRRHLARHLHNQFLFHLCSVFGELAQYAPVLREDDQATGRSLQWYGRSEPGKMALEHPRART